MLFYAVVSAATEKAVGLFLHRGDADRFLAEVRDNDNELADTLRLEAVELDP